MRRVQFLLVSLLLLLAVPVASAADRPENREKYEKTVAAATGSVGAVRAVGVTESHVTLEAGVVPGDASGTATFEYGATTDYGLTAAANPAKLPRDGATATASIDHLTPSTTYHVRVVLGTGDSALAGPDATFTTAAPAGAGVKRPEDKGPKVDTGKRPNEPGRPIAPVQVPKAPVLGESLAVGPRAGTVKVRSADGKAVALTAGANVPAGSLNDATNGTVALTTALDEKGHVQ